MRLNASQPPLIAPYFSMASIAYCEQVGIYRQQGGLFHLLMLPFFPDALEKNVFFLCI